jgi:putative tRNA adenosine deaminase-associated protein
MVGCVESSGGTVSYFAAAVVRGTDGWSASEFSLTGASDVEDVAERLREVDPDAPVALLFVESDDVYLVILRLDDGEELRVFGSDAAFAEESRLGAVLLGDVKEPVLDLVNEVVEGGGGEEEPAASTPDTDPVGDPDLLTDLGVPALKLLELCAQEGLLPSDITAEVCQVLGCGDEVEELREG